MVNEKWQPVGPEQFAIACAMCVHKNELDTDICVKCKCEQEPGFEFDFRKYVVREHRKQTMVGAPRDAGKVCHLEQRVAQLTKELKECKEDRDFWKNIAESALRRLY